MDESTARRPPYAEDAEKGVLGSILQDWENIPDLCVDKHLYPQDFYVPANRLIYSAMGDMAASERPIDLLSLAEYLRTAGNLDRVGGERYLHGLVDATPTTAHCGHYIDIVKRHSLGRQIIENARAAEASVYTQEDMEVVRSVAEAAFASMEHAIPAKTVRSVLDQLLADIESGLRGDPVEIGISTGYKTLDALSPGGMRKGSSYWLSGKPKAGKTSLKDNIIEKLLLEGRTVADLTLEMTMEEEIKKLCSIHTNTNLTSMIIGESKVPAVPRKFEPFGDILRSDQFFIADQSMVRDIKEFRSWARRMVSKNGVEIIFVDYVQKLGVPGQDRMKIEEITSKQVEAVTAAAGILGIPILGVVEENDNGGVRGSQRGDYASAGHWQLRRTNPKEKPEAPDFSIRLSVTGKVGRYGPSGDTKKLTLTGATGLIEEDRHVETQQELA